VKLISAGVIARLVRNGMLAWDTPIREYLPEFRQRTDEIGTKATVRDLLAMRTGLAVSHTSYAQQSAEYTISRSEMLRTACYIDAVTPFRKKFIYSQWNHGILTDLVEEVTGKSFGTCAREILLNRMKMTRTTFDHVDGGENVSSAHAIRNDGTACRILPPAVHDEKGFAAATGCKASIKDLLKMYQSFLSSHSHQRKYGVHATPGSPWLYTRKMLEPYVLVGKSDIEYVGYCLGLYRIRLPANLSVASLNQQMLEPARIPLPKVGLKREGLHVYHYTAASPGVHGSMFLVPETESAVVVLTNSLPLVDSTDFTAHLLLTVMLGEETKELQEEFLGLAEMTKLFQMIGYERLAVALERKKTDTLPSLPLESYEGDYWNLLYNRAFNVTVLGNGLLMRVKER
jgi:CubicO group peptidase (beta-lactamase class C family)